MLQAKGSHSFWVSDVFSNFSDDMIEFCDALIDNRSIRIALCDEPGGVVISAKPNLKQQHIVTFAIEEIDNKLSGFYPSETGKELVSVVMKRKQLVAALISEMWKTHNFLKEPSYQINRDIFPHSNLIALNRKWDQSSLGPSFLK